MCYTPKQSKLTAPEASFLQKNESPLLQLIQSDKWIVLRSLVSTENFIYMISETQLQIRPSLLPLH